MTGTDDYDLTYGLGGNDNTSGHFGNDFMDGGPGDDDLRGAFGNDKLYGGDGDDFIFAHDRLAVTMRAGVVECDGATSPEGAIAR